MSDSDGKGRGAPHLVLIQTDGNQQRLRLGLKPMVEVPSGTLGPWVTLGESVDAALADQADQCLQQAMANDAIGSPDGLPGERSITPLFDWHMENTKVVTHDGETVYFSPATVCWCADDGEPRFDCDHDLAPAADMLNVGAVITGRYAVVADERLTGDARRRSPDQTVDG
jgi:hypothetical protein